MSGTVGVALKCFDVPGIIPLEPAIESLRGNVEVTAGQSGIAFVGIVVIKPFQPFVGFRRNIPDPFPYRKAPGSKRASYLHDTL
jgi:hypothetical protein